MMQALLCLLKGLGSSELSCVRKAQKASQFSYSTAVLGLDLSTNSVFLSEHVDSY